MRPTVLSTARNDSLREGRELNALFAQLEDLCHDLLDGALPAVKHGADLYGGGFNHGAHCFSFQIDITERPSEHFAPRICRVCTCSDPLNEG